MIALAFDRFTIPISIILFYPTWTHFGAQHLRSSMAFEHDYKIASSTIAKSFADVRESFLPMLCGHCTATNCSNVGVFSPRHLENFPSYY